MELSGIFKIFTRKRKIGLALSGGNVKGMVHIGVLKALEKHQVPIACISGTSAGSIAAALYASGLPITEIEKIVMDLNWLKILYPEVSSLGFFSSKKIEDFINKNLPIKTFKEAKIPLAIVATDIKRGREYIFKHPEEQIALAVRASCTIPGLFGPVKHDDKLLVDGVFANNLPVNQLQALGATYTIGVNLMPLDEVQGAPSIFFDLLNKANDLKEANLVKSGFYKCDLMLNPVKEYISIMGANKKNYEHMIRLGEQAVEKEITKIKRYV